MSKANERLRIENDSRWNWCQEKGCLNKARKRGGKVCRPCMDAKTRAKNPEYYKIKADLYYLNNRERLLNNQRIYRQNNKEEVSFKNACYRDQHREEAIAYARQYRKRNRVV